MWAATAIVAGRAPVWQNDGMRSLAIETVTHGRVLVQDPVRGPATALILAFHGYAQSAEDMMNDVRRLSGADHWTIASVQGLHRFYARGAENVVASWMTRQDRDDAIADNVAYVDRVVDAIGVDAPLVYMGFSQGAAMAYRAARLGRHRADAVVALAGDIPPELKAKGDTARWPPVFIGAGLRDTWYTPARLDADVTFLARRGVPNEALRFDGGHEWTDTLRESVSRWLQGLIQDAARSSA